MNDPPVANPDQATASDDQAVTINVLSNDSDADGSLDPSTVQMVTSPSHGTAAVQNDGAILYTPAAAFSGTDTFTYTVKDSQGAISNVATVTITVTALANASGRRGGGGFDVFDVLGLLLLAAWKVTGRTRRQ